VELQGRGLAPVKSYEGNRRCVFRRSGRTTEGTAQEGEASELYKDRTEWDWRWGLPEGKITGKVINKTWEKDDNCRTSKELRDERAGVVRGLGGVRPRIFLRRRGGLLGGRHGRCWPWERSPSFDRSIRTRGSAAESAVKA